MLNKIKNWLLYDQPLFSKETKQWEYTVSKNNYKKNWLGLIKISDSYQIKYNWCFIRLESHLQEDDIIDDYRNVLTIGFGHRYRKWLLPFSIIKPILDYHFYKRDTNGKVIEPKEIRWSKYEEREYGLTIVKEEGYFHLTWDYCSNLMNNITGHKSKSIWLWFFWKQCNRTKQELLNLDGSLYKDITDVKDTDTLDRYDLIKQYEKSQPYFMFKILDYDKEEIDVIGRLERNTYSYGRGKFTRWLMKFFKKPLVYTSLELEFLKEIGPRKGSWKGGTTGHAVRLLEDEYAIEAFRRYCVTPELRGSRNDISTNLTFLKGITYKSYDTDERILRTVVNGRKMQEIIIYFDESHKPNNNIHPEYDIAVRYEFVEGITNKPNYQIGECYIIDNNSRMEVFLFKTLLHRYKNHGMESNNLRYLITKEAMVYLKNLDGYGFKDTKFIKHVVDNSSRIQKLKAV
jgi:hypothetical protein